MKKPVLILGAGLRLTVTIARSLYRRGIPVIVSPIMQGEPPIKSRAIQKHVLLPDFRKFPVKFFEQLTALIQAEEIDMIVPSGDGAMIAIGQHYEALSKLVHLGCPPPSIMEQVLDKRLTIAAAKKCGIPVAATRSVEAISEVGKFVKDLRFPLIAKPAVRKGENSYRIEYFITIEDLLESITRDSEWLLGGLLQEYIPGVGVGIGVLMSGGEPLVMFQHRRIKELPYMGGVSVTAEAEAIDPVLCKHAVSLLREIKWQGIAMVEYRYNTSDKSFVLMEINGRYWGSLFLPFLAGVDFPYYEWQLAHGEQPNIPKKYSIGVRARWLAGDLSRIHNILDGSHRSKIESISCYKEVVRFLMDFFRTRDAVFSLSDPMPAIQELQETSIAFAKYDLKRLISMVLPEVLLKQVKIYRNLGFRLRPVFLKQQIRRFMGKQPILFKQGTHDINNILFLCLGNIIRSPTAALLLKRKLALTEKKNLNITSAGLWKKLAHIEPRPSPEAVMEIATEFGVSLTEHRSQQITQHLIDTSDAIFVMDYENEAMLLSEYPDARCKVFLLGTCIAKLPLSQWEIADPYGGTKDDIHKCLATINNRVDELARILTE